jgi:hypothetical protein
MNQALRPHRCGPETDDDVGNGRYDYFVAVDTHVMEYDGGELIVVSDSYRDISKFARVLHGLNGTDRFALSLWALPPGMDNRQAVAAGLDREYIQAAGRADALTAEICKPGGEQWGVDWVRYVIGHPHDGDAPLDVPIVLPRSTEMRSRFEIFNADEAAQLFFSYYKTGDIPTSYALRAEQGFTRTGGNIDLRDRTPHSH